MSICIGPSSAGPTAVLSAGLASVFVARFRPSRYVDPSSRHLPQVPNHTPLACPRPLHRSHRRRLTVVELYVQLYVNDRDCHRHFGHLGSSPERARATAVSCSDPRGHSVRTTFCTVGGG